MADRDTDFEQGDIISQWVKVAVQFKKTGKCVDKFDLEQLKTSAKELQETVETLNHILGNTSVPSTSTKRPASPTENNNIKRKRKPSGNISLKELKDSLDFNPSPVASVEKLQRCTSAEDKVNLLYSWETSAVRLQTRASFHQGFYLQQLIKEHHYSTNDLCTLFPDIPSYHIKRNLQLYNTLGNYRTLLYSNISVSRLWRNISQIKKELDSLSPDEQQWWTTPPTNSEASCFIKCYQEWFGRNPTKNIYYTLDIYDNDLSHWTNNGLIEQITTVVASFEHPEVDNLDIKDIPNLIYDKYMLWYYIEKQPTAHCAIITKSNGIWNTADELLQHDMEKKGWQWAKFCF